MHSLAKCLVLGLAAIAATTGAASAADRVRLISSTKMPFEMFAPNQAQAEGYFKAENLDVPMIYGSGGAATLQTLITGSQDIASGVGVLSVISAFAKGAPVTIIGNGKRGVGELFWYVPKESKIKKFQDIGTRELAYSRPGSTTHLAVLFIKKALGLNSKLTSVGGLSSSRTQAMSGQVATGWSVPPINLNLLRSGEARLIGKGTAATGLRGHTIRVIAANSNWLKKNRPVAKRFMRAFWKGLKFQYEGGEPALKRYANAWKLDINDAREAPKFVEWKDVTFTPIGELDSLANLALEFKRIKKPLTAAQKKALVDIVFDPAKEG